MNNLNSICQLLSLERWDPRDSVASQKSESSESCISRPPEWSTLEQAVANCTACPLHETRTQTVFGVGNRQASLMLIGEAPGFHEDQKGEPFVGRAGQLLNAMLQTIGFNRSDIFITNILKCRPPNNRDPRPEEIAACTGFLHQQISLVKPRLLLAVGRIAAQYLLATKSTLGKLRNQLYEYKPLGVPLIVTYHPAYLLRNPADKKKAFADLLFTKEKLESLSQKDTCLT